MVVVCPGLPDVELRFARRPLASSFRLSSIFPVTCLPDQDKPFQITFFRTPSRSKLGITSLLSIGYAHSRRNIGGYPLRVAAFLNLYLKSARNSRAFRRLQRRIRLGRFIDRHSFVQGVARASCLACRRGLLRSGQSREGLPVGRLGHAAFRENRGDVPVRRHVK